MKRPPDINNWESTAHRPLEPGERKVRDLGPGEAFAWGLVLLPVFAAGAVLRRVGVLR